MRRDTRIVVPTLQMLAVIVVYAVPKFTHGGGQLGMDMSLAQQLIQKLNYPLIVVWAPILLAMDRLSPHFLALPRPLFIAELIIFSVVLLSTVVAFWYLVIRELEMRKCGSTIFRFSSSWKQTLAIVVIFLLGAGAFIAAYLTSEYSLNPYNIRLDKILGGLILAAWGVGLTAMAIHDFKKFLRNATST